MRRPVLAIGVALLLTGCGSAAMPAAPQAPAAASPQAPSATAAPAATSTAPERVSGKVKDFSGSKVTLDDGRSFTLSQKARITRLQAASQGDIRTGLYVAVTAKRQPDNTLLASSVNIFPEEMRGVGPGQRPMDGGNLMTNATVDQVQADGFTVTFPGGGAQVRFAPGARVGRIVIAMADDIRAGETVSALVSGGSASSLSIAGGS